MGVLARVVWVCLGSLALSLSLSGVCVRVWVGVTHKTHSQPVFFKYMKNKSTKHTHTHTHQSHAAARGRGGGQGHHLQPRLHSENQFQESSCWRDVAQTQRVIHCSCLCQRTKRQRHERGEFVGAGGRRGRAAGRACARIS